MADAAESPFSVLVPQTSEILAEQLAERQRDPVAMFRQVDSFFRTLFLRWNSEIRPEEVDFAASAGLWLCYPSWYGTIECKALDVFGAKWKSRSEPYLAITSLQAAHSAGARILIELAEHLHMDGSAIAPAAEICQELFHQHGMKCCQRARFHNWPTCLGRFELELPADLRVAIRAGQAAIERLFLKAKIAKQVLQTLARPFSDIAGASPARLELIGNGTRDQERSLASPAPAILRGWFEILKAVGRRDEPRDRKWLLRLNKNTNGPIKNGGRGTQPYCDQRELLKWWESQSQRAEELTNNALSKAATVGDGAVHTYGRNGSAIPEIGGQIKRRRSDHRI